MITLKDRQDGGGKWLVCDCGNDRQAQFCKYKYTKIFKDNHKITKVPQEGIGCARCKTNISQEELESQLHVSGLKLT